MIKVIITRETFGVDFDCLWETSIESCTVHITVPRIVHNPTTLAHLFTIGADWVWVVGERASTINVFFSSSSSFSYSYTAYCAHTGQCRLSAPEYAAVCHKHHRQVHQNH